MQKISAENAQQKMQQGAVLIDIRETIEYRREHIQGAISIPLSVLEKKRQEIKGKTVIFYCTSGMRTQNAAEKLATLTTSNGNECFLLEGGINAWKKANLTTVVDKSQPIDLMRQVQIVAGTLVLLGTILGCLTNPAFYLLSALVGAGLLFAGISGFCGLARLLAKMPWNSR